MAENDNKEPLSLFTFDVSLCVNCMCVTHTLTDGRCGKCKCRKIDTGKLISDVMQWGRAHGLDDPKAQLNKVIEEVGEIAHEITRNINYSTKLKDAIGDTLVTLIILSDILGLSIWDCLDSAYGEIKNRKGKTVNSTFIKDDEV